MPILPLPQFEADLKELLDQRDRETYEALKAPKTLVVRFGSMKLIGEFLFASTVKPGCGSKVVVRTFRGTELGEMLTSTCPNSGCSKSVSRKDMLEYIDRSGGHDYPFYTEGKVLRLATHDDLRAQESIEQSKHEWKVNARTIAQRLGVHAKIVEVEPILGGESMTVFYSIDTGEAPYGGEGAGPGGPPPPSPHAVQQVRSEMRDFAREFGQLARTHIELRSVGARDEARLTADYEKCGQYCCCKNFLKVLRPVSMKSAKVQKATLDPLKISGRCGRLMCCLRYEDQTYDELSKRLPRRKSRVGTPEGDGIVLDGQILTQLVLVLLDTPGPDGKARQIAVPVESLTSPVDAKGPIGPYQDRAKEARDAARNDRKRGPAPSPTLSTDRPRTPPSESPQQASTPPSSTQPSSTQPSSTQPSSTPPRRPEQEQPKGGRILQRGRGNQKPPAQHQSPRAPGSYQPGQAQPGQAQPGQRPPTQRQRTDSVDDIFNELMGGDDLGFGPRPPRPDRPRGPKDGPRDGQRDDQGRGGRPPRGSDRPKQ